MKIELKKLKVFEAGSEETYCFNADIWIDGRYQGSARNDGRGGSHIISPPSIESQINAWGKTLPHYELGLPSHEDPSKPMMVEQTSESIINNLIETELNKRDLKRLLKKKYLFTLHGKDGLFQVPLEPNWLKTLTGGTNLKNILNNLPLDEAMKIYLEQGK